jgi:hypothetical protein
LLTDEINRTQTEKTVYEFYQCFRNPGFTASVIPNKLLSVVVVLAAAAAAAAAVVVVVVVVAAAIVIGVIFPAALWPWDRLTL